MSRYDELLKLKQDIDNAITTLTELLERVEKVVAKQDEQDGKIGKILTYSSMSEEDKSDLVKDIKVWIVGESLKVGDLRRVGNIAYEVIQPHTTQADWRPEGTPALYKVHIPTKNEEGEEVIPDFKQPTGAHDVYNVGDKVIYEGKIYESVIDNNSFSPTDYAQGWKEIVKQ